MFTTLVDGSEVNANIYAAKEDVYLDGGPGPGAPQAAAGLDDGTYVFQVPNPSGKILLSTDPARCRQFVVSGGIITSVVAQPDGCQHAAGLNIDHGATTVQLFPYNDTPNPGGVYKVWATRVGDYVCSLSVVDYGASQATGKHGFGPAHSKTDNFKVKAKGIREIDTRFVSDLNDNGFPDFGEPLIDGQQVTWVDSLGASNNKSSYQNLNINVNHEVHVEAVEDGNHRISIENQPGCTVGTVYLNGLPLSEPGPQIVSVDVTKNMKDITILIYVTCMP